MLIKEYQTIKEIILKKILQFSSQKSINKISDTWLQYQIFCSDPGNCFLSFLHGWVLHVSITPLGDPTQSNPPCCFSGLLQCRFWWRVPLPHVFVHDVQLHADQPPLTGRKEIYVKIYRTNQCQSQCTFTLWYRVSTHIKMMEIALDTNLSDKPL